VTALSAPVAPRSLRSRQVVWAAASVAALLALLAVAFVLFEARAIRENQLARAELYNRALVDQTMSAVSGTETILRSLLPAVAQRQTVFDTAGLAAVFENGLRGRPFLRSISLLDGQGRVLASSNGANSDLTLEPTALGGVAATERGVRLAPLASGRDLFDLGQVPLAEARVLALPMVMPLPSGDAVLVALINPDHLATLFESTLNDSPLRALLLGLDGRFMVGTAGVGIAPGTALAPLLPAFTRHLPVQESASDVGAGADGGQALSAFRVTRQWPLVVLVEQPYSVYQAEVARVAQWAVAGLLLTWALLALGAWTTRRSLLRDEQLSRDLAVALAATQASESRKLAILQSSLDAIVTVGTDGRVVEFNAAAEAMFGHPVAQVLGQKWYEVMVPPIHRHAHQAGMAHYLATGDARGLNRRIEIDALRAGGAIFPVEVTMVPVQTSAGAMFTATLRDITERRRAESDLAAARQREMAVGTRIQQSLLVTAPPPTIAGLQFSSHNQASQGIDGDFVEIIRVGPHCVDLITGDVMGKGLAAAMMGAATKLQLSRSMAELMTAATELGALPRPAEVVAAVHRAMTPALQGLEAFVTLCYLRIDTQHNSVTWVGCGHEETLLVRRNGTPLVLPNQHPPLGVLDRDDYTEDTLALYAGEALFLCSDGVTDALRPDGTRVGRDRVVAAVARRMRLHATPAAVLHSLRSDLLQGGVRLQDDVTMVVVQREPETATTVRVELPMRVSELRQVRAFVAQHTRAAGLEEGASGLLEVACVEAFTNILRHGKGLLEGAPVELLARREAGQLVIELVHLGEAFTPPAELPDTDFAAFPEGGFGLEIIRGASDGVEYLHTSGVSTIRMTKRLG
jgi:PAS domain S-box-containing protein